ncbi:MAG TPA: GNAT family N-acetyltransferase [Leeuwenhoekiella sp.]|nr:GNAT family N-acetyltransferase [Leeuwenhoekiella sp.]
MPPKAFSTKLLKQGEVDDFHRLAHKIWPVTFKNILSEAQIAYMLEMMYSEESLIKQQEDGCKLFLIKADDQNIGYLSIQHNKENSGKTKVHKIYVLPEFHGTGAGRFLMDLALTEAKKEGATAVFLNVNRYNNAIGFYEHYGFKKLYTEDNDIGQGYLMEDWVMEIPMPSP